MKKILIGALFILGSINSFAAKEYYVDSGTPGSNKCCRTCNRWFETKAGDLQCTSYGQCAPGTLNKGPEACSADIVFTNPIPTKAPVKFRPNNIRAD
jgi:hypothetical protein